MSVRFASSISLEPFFASLDAVVKSNTSVPKRLDGHIDSQQDAVASTYEFSYTSRKQFPASLR